MKNSVDHAALEILDAGILSTVQDLGYSGYKYLGIAESGAMDRTSLILANRLLGNNDNSACLELTFQGPTVLFRTNTWIALTGAKLTAYLNDAPICAGKRYRVQKNDVLTFGNFQYGIRSYLAIKGGVSVPKIMGSRSTYVFAGFGGYEGRPLAKGDTIFAFNSQKKIPSTEEIPHDLLIGSEFAKSLRVIIGPHDNYFEPESISDFFGSPYEVTIHSNRMGYRLDGPRLKHKMSPTIVSTATPLGIIQVPGKGFPMILLNERGTTGGYTQLGCVIKSDLDLLAQTFAMHKFFFQPVDIKEAHRINKKKWEYINSVVPSFG